MNPARSAGVVVASQILRLVFSLIGLLTISRLLTPAEFGLFAMATAVLGVGDLFRDFGLSMAAIQAGSLSRAQQSNLFWLNLGVGVLLAGIAVASAHAIADIYAQPLVAGVIMALGCTFIASGASAQFRVGLIRRDRFAALAISDAGSQAAALALAIVLAFQGFGIWALVGQVATQAVVALLLLTVQLRWKPGLPNRSGDIRSLLAFGGNLLGTQVLTYLGRNVDNILLGKFWGPSALGFYSKAYTLYSMPQQQALAPFTDLVVRTLASSRSDVSIYRRRVAKMQLVANYVSLSLFCTLIALADPVVQLALGPGWSRTAILLQILSIGGVFQLLGNVYYWLFLSEGLTRLHLRLVLVTQPVAVVCILIGLPFGASGVAWGATAGLFVEWLVPATYGAARTSQSAKRLLLNVLRPSIFCGGGAIVMHITTILIPSATAPLKLLAGLGMGIVWASACFLLWPALRRDLVNVRDLGLAAFRLKRSPKSANEAEVSL